MSDILIYLEKAFTHDLITAWLLHIIFLMILSVPFTFKDWQKLLKTFCFFSSGIITMLILLNFDIFSIKNTTIHFLICLSIMVSAIYHLFTAGKTINNQIVNIFLIFLGFIHGLYLNSLYKKSFSVTNHSIVEILQFITAIIIMQIVILFVAVLLGFLSQIVFKFSKRDWALIVTSFAIGAVGIKMIGIQF